MDSERFRQLLDTRGPFVSNRQVLSEQGAAPAKTLRADEALPMFAVSVGAALVRTDERTEDFSGF